MSHFVTETLGGLITQYKRLPSPLMTSQEATEAGFSSEYAKAVPVREAMTPFINYIKPFVESPFAEECASEMPPSAVSSYAEPYQALQTSLERVFTLIRKDSNIHVQQTEFQNRASEARELTDRIRSALDPALVRFFALLKAGYQARDLTEDLIKAEEVFSRIKSETEKVEAERKKQEATLGLTNYMKDSQEAIDGHTTSGTIALIIFLSLLALLNVIVFWLLSDAQFLGVGPTPPRLPARADVWEFVTYILAKILVVGVSAIPCLIACRLYLTHQHNIVSLRHQKLAFQALLDLQKILPPDDKNRENVTVQCVQAICSREASGFLKADADVTAYSTLVEKVLQAVGKN